MAIVNVFFVLCVEVRYSSNDMVKGMDFLGAKNMKLARKALLRSVKITPTSLFYRKNIFAIALCFMPKSVSYPIIDRFILRRRQMLTARGEQTNNQHSK